MMPMWVHMSTGTHLENDDTVFLCNSTGFELVGDEGLWDIIFVLWYNFLIYLNFSDKHGLSKFETKSISLSIMENEKIFFLHLLLSFQL